MGSTYNWRSGATPTCRKEQERNIMAKETLHVGETEEKEATVGPRWMEDVRWRRWEEFDIARIAPVARDGMEKDGMAADLARSPLQQAER
mmetsp:Transcript_9892/g.60314  ORF Transcript_9892/g.60314 Transcript_9892/m.60314 type:complete len:90 (-) Transcript_9892:525-794(-)